MVSKNIEIIVILLAILAGIAAFILMVSPVPFLWGKHMPFFIFPLLDFCN